MQQDDHSVTCSIPYAHHGKQYDFRPQSPVASSISKQAPLLNSFAERFSTAPCIADAVAYTLRGKQYTSEPQSPVTSSTSHILSNQAVLLNTKWMNSAQRYASPLLSEQASQPSMPDSTQDSKNATKVSAKAATVSCSDDE